MRVTADTKTKDILPLLNEERAKQIAETVEPYPLEKPLLKMTVGEFIMALDESFFLQLMKAKRAVVAFGRYRQYMAELESVTNYIQRYAVQQDADERTAAQGLDFPTLQERILIECVHHYHLHSTAEAERLPIADWLLMVKSEGANAQYQRALSKIQSKKSKK